LFNIHRDLVGIKEEYKPIRHKTKQPRRNGLPSEALAKMRGVEQKVPFFSLLTKEKKQKKVSRCPPLAKNPLRSVKYKKALLRSTLVFFNPHSSDFLHASERGGF